VKSKQIVYIVDDEAPVRKSLSALTKSVGYESKTFDSAESFVEAFDTLESGCLLLDVCMPGLSGLELQEKLRKRHIQIPTIIISGHADVPMAVRAMKSGAADFIEKPFRSEELLVRIRQCMAGEFKRRQSARRQREAESRLASLTPREEDVMRGIVEGQRNKQIAADLGLSARTVEAHRASIMEKLKARTVSDVVRQVLASNGLT
jgi:FixJ family two-component response regulator